MIVREMRRAARTRLGQFSIAKGDTATGVADFACLLGFACQIGMCYTAAN